MADHLHNNINGEINSLFRSTMHQTMRKNLIYSAIWELLIAIIIIVLPYVLLMIQIDLLFPVSIGNISYIWMIGYLALGLIIMQIFYAIFISKLENTKIGKILGWIIGISMLLFLPYGTFFGILFLQDLRYPEFRSAFEKNMDVNKENAKTVFLENSSQQIMLSGLIALFSAAAILWFHKLILTQQVDMAYPIITTAKIIVIENFGKIFYLIFCMQIVIGYLYPQYAARNWMKILIIMFGIFQIFAISIIIQWFLIVSADFIFDDQNLIYLIIRLGWIPGIIMRPLGIFFGIKMLRMVKTEKFSIN